MLLLRRLSFKIFSISASSSSLNQLQLYYTQNIKSSFTQHEDLSIRSSLANIKNFSKAGCFEDALHLYHLVRASNMNATHLPFVYVLKACGGLFSVHEGLSIHGIIIKAGLGQNVNFMNSLIEMYTAFGHLNSALHVFEAMPQRNLVSWNMMMLGYTACSQPQAALQLCVLMKNNRITLDEVGLKIVLPICGQVEALQVGESIHGRLVITGLYNTTALATATMDMYAKCGQLGAATKVFDEILTKDVISWNALMTGCIKARKFEAVFQLLYQMFAQGIKPSITTILLALQACTHLLALQVGKTIHGHIISTGIYVDISVKGLLVDMYCKCGELSFACQAFTEITYGRVNTWSCMINGLGIHGFARESIMLFFLMLKQGIEPDKVCFLLLLFACSHQGLTQEGWKVFYYMVSHFFIEPTMEHCASMADLISRAGCLHEALRLFNAMPQQSKHSMLGAVLGGCRIHGDQEKGREVRDRLFDLECKIPGFYKLMVSIMVGKEHWDEVIKLREVIRDRKLWGNAGYSFVEVSNGG